MPRRRRNLQFWNIPNAITVARIAAIPLILVVLAEDTVVRSWVAGWIFIFAILGDWLDGYLARRMNLQSTLGAFLDPLADKLIVCSVLIMLVTLDRVEDWLVALLICREIAISSLRAVAASEGLIIAASKWGKFKTAFQGTSLALLCLHYPVWGVSLQRVGYGLLLVATLFALSSAWNYFASFLDELDSGALA
jgi:CDP-diacylglycerol--glycerol-3-phosphate 3-phosphatidyltransferase